MTLIQRAPSGTIDAAGSFASAGEAEPWADDLRNAWQNVRARWRLVLAVPLVLVALVLAGRFLFPAHYTASASLMIDPGGLQVVANDVSAKGQVGDASLLVIDSQINVLTSSLVLGQVVDSEHLDEDPEFTRPTPLQAVIGMATAIFSTGGEPIDDRTIAINALARAVSVGRVDRSFVIEVGVTTRSRAKSVLIANAITTAYLAADQAARGDSARRASSTMVARLNELSRAARTADDTVQQFKAAHNMVGSGQALVSDQQLGEMTTALSAAHARTVEQRARLDQIETVARGEAGLQSIAEVVQSATITQLRSQLAATRSRLQGLLTQGGDRFPSVIEARAEVASLERQISDEVQRIASAAANDYERAGSNEAALQAGLDTLKSQAVTLGADFRPVARTATSGGRRTQRLGPPTSCAAAN